MGYCYQGRKLVCDICGATGGVRKYNCPFGWCSPIAACPTCHKNRKERFSKKAHREAGCEKLAKGFEEEQEKKQNLLSQGIPVRCSASINGDKVHVLFQKGIDIQEGFIGYYMSASTYHPISLGVVATPDDYRKYGELEPAPDHFY